MRPHLAFCVAITATALLTPRARAQTAGAARHAAPVIADTTEGDDSHDEAHEVPPRVATGVTVGAIHFASGRTDNALSVNVLLRPVSWLKISAAPGFGHTSYGRASSSGFTDIPLSVGVLHEFNDVTWSPSVSTALGTTISPGDTAGGLALGRTTYGASAGLGFSPTERFSVWSSLEHPLSSNSGNGSTDVEGSYALGRTTASLGFSTEIGTADSGAVLSRSFAAGLAYKLRGPLTLTVDGSHGITTGAPSWTLSVGLGTAYAGISQLSPTSPFKRLRSALGGHTTGSSGFSAGGIGVGSCHRTGTC